jgi:hypothetical protein
VFRRGAPGLLPKHSCCGTCEGGKRSVFIDLGWGFAPRSRAYGPRDLASEQGGVIPFCLLQHVYASLKRFGAIKSGMIAPLSKGDHAGWEFRNPLHHVCLSSLRSKVSS